MKLKNYHKKEYWIELACWLNSQNKKITLHNHALELNDFVDGETPGKLYIVTLHPILGFNLTLKISPPRLI